jgi:adenosine kinase
MANILVTGTLAHDDVGSFNTALGSNTRNVKLESLYRDFGGCAMNIAYNLKLLGHEPTPFAYVGDDYAGDYQAHVRKARINEAGLLQCPGTISAKGLILTDCEGQQFTAFYPGPDGREQLSTDLLELLRAQQFAAAVIAPDHPAKMKLCAHHLASIPIRIWCPGQYAELLTEVEIAEMLSFPNILILNEHEWHCINRRDLVMPECIVITAGAAPVTIESNGVLLNVPITSIQQEQQIDPTGCGDAFVAGFLHGRITGLEPDECVLIAAKLAGACLRQRGCQRHDWTAS